MNRFNEGLTSVRYTLLYSAVHNYCARSNNSSTTVGYGASPRNSANLIGAELYSSLTRYLENHLQNIRQELSNLWMKFITILHKTMGTIYYSCSCH
ncbi:unnamed protein product [Cunninghamella echinulata]